MSFSIPRVVVFRCFHHVRHFTAALGAHTLENQIPVVLFDGEIGDRYRVRDTPRTRLLPGFAVVLPWESCPTAPLPSV